MAHSAEEDTDGEDDLMERIVEGIEDAHEEDFATKDEVRDAFLS